MLRSVLATSFVLCAATFAMAHCQVPCGIYGDQMRFEQMLEDEHTISKAQQSLQELTKGEVDAQAVNQMARWVASKEEHATKIQSTIASYFMAQRIKPTSEGYDKQIKSAHAVIIAAMKCKQSADPATAVALEKAIFAFYKAYEGKEPAFDHKH